MTSKQRTRLTKAYKKYKTGKRSKNILLDFFRSFMPEMIRRTTRLEGEKASKSTISSLFK